MRFVPTLPRRGWKYDVRLWTIVRARAWRCRTRNEITGGQRGQPFEETASSKRFHGKPSDAEIYNAEHSSAMAALPYLKSALCNALRAYVAAARKALAQSLQGQMLRR